MCVSAQDVAGIGRVLSLTTWKNLGGVHIGQWARWYAHSWNVDRFSRRFLVQPEDAIVMRDLSKGTSACTAFHDLSADAVKASHWYTPLLSRRLLNAFKEQVKTSGNWWKLPELIYTKPLALGLDIGSSVQEITQGSTG